MAKRHGRMEEWLKHGARTLQPLSLGDTVAIQDQAAKNGKAGRWTKSGVVVVHGNRSITQRNRRFLRKLSPFQPVNPVNQGEDVVPHTVTRSQSNPVDTPRATPVPQTPDRVTTRSQVKTKSPPNSPISSKMSNPASLATRAASYRRSPLANPGKDIVTKLKKKEQRGSHLSLGN
jgi:hypothetical protein